MEFMEFCVCSGTSPTRSYFHTVLDKTTKFRGFYTMCSFCLGDWKWVTGGTIVGEIFFVFFLFYSKGFIYLSNILLKFYFCQQWFFFSHLKLRFKQITKLMVHLWEMYACKRCLTAIHPASERMMFMVRVLAKKLNRCVYNTFSVHLLKNTIGKEKSVLSNRHWHNCNHNYWL